MASCRVRGIVILIAIIYKNQNTQWYKICTILFIDMFKFINNIASLHDQQEGVLSAKLKFSEGSASCNSLCTCNTCHRIW